MLKSGRIRASTPPPICSTGISRQGCGARVTSCPPVRNYPHRDSSSNPGDPVPYEFNLASAQISSTWEVNPQVSVLSQSKVHDREPSRARAASRELMTRLNHAATTRRQ
jgi:hypothetical protein